MVKFILWQTSPTPATIRTRLDVEGTVKKILTTDYVKEELERLDTIKMKEKLLLVGAGGFGRVVMEHAMEQQYDVAFVDDGYDIGADVCGIKIVGHIEDLERLFLS